MTKVLTKKQIRDLYWKHCFNKEEIYKFVMKCLPSSCREYFKKGQVVEFPVSSEVQFGLDVSTKGEILHKYDITICGKVVWPERMDENEKRVRYGNMV